MKCQSSPVSPWTFLHGQSSTSKPPYAFNMKQKRFEIATVAASISMNHSLVAPRARWHHALLARKPRFLLSSRTNTIKSRLLRNDCNERNRIERSRGARETRRVNLRLGWGQKRAPRRKGIRRNYRSSGECSTLLPREYLSGSSALCCVAIKISAVNYAMPRRLLATVSRKLPKLNAG